MRRWTKEETEYLYENVGKVTLKTISINLNRTIKTIYCKMDREGITNTKELSGAYTANYISKSFGYATKKRCQYPEFVTKQFLNGLKYKKMRTCKGLYFYFIKGIDFWKYAENNKDKFNFKRYIMNSILPEPVWLNEAIKNEKKAKLHKKFWTKEEDEKLKQLFQFNYSINDICEFMNRNKSSVYHRLNRLRLNRVINIPWTKEEIDILINLNNKGKSQEYIAYELGRDISHIRCKFQRLNLKSKTYWTNEEVLKLINLRKKGLTYKEISSQLNRTVKSIEWKYNKLKKQGVL